jgi:hypothetical protein
MAAKAKFSFTDTPKFFNKAVQIVMLDGTTAPIDFKFIYRTRSQFAELIDANVAAAKKQQADAEAAAQAENKQQTEVDKFPERSIAKWFAEADAHDVAYVLKIVDSWDLDQPLDVAALERLEDEYPGSLVSIANVYRQSVAEARTKN